MTDFDEQKYSAEIVKRLDEIFSDKTQIRKSSKKAHIIMGTNLLYNLRKLLLSIEWEISEDILTKYLNETIKLQRLFQRNRYINRLLQIQYFYGKIIKKYPDIIPLKTFKILQTLYNSMNKILGNKKLSDFEKKEIVVQEIHRYRNFRKHLIIKKNISSEDESYKIFTEKRLKISPNKDSKREIKKIIVQDEIAYKQYMDSTLLEMKAFIKNEIKRLKYELINLQLKLTMFKELKSHK